MIIVLGIMASHNIVRKFWFLSMAVAFMFNNVVVSEANPAAVVGAVYCDTCFQNGFSTASHFISGAMVAVECGGAGIFRRQVETNEKGEFRVDLPFSVAKHAKKIKACSVKLIGSGDSSCAVASPAASSSSSLRLKAGNSQGTHTFSAGSLAFRPRELPALCRQKPTAFKAQKSLKPTPNGITFPPPLQDPPAGQGLLPPLPELPPLPVQLPPLIPVPGIPGSPPQNSQQQELFFRPLPQVPLPANPFPPPSLLPPGIPNPFQPPPSVLPPIPVLQPPPSIFPPNPFQPSPPFSLPPIPGLFPSPPPPPAFPIPLPPIFPGIPPAAP